VTVNDTISLWVEKNPSYTADFAVVNLTITANGSTADTDGDGLPDTIDAYPLVPDTTPPTFTITSPAEGATLP
jgi:hypothetical protein